MLKQHVIEGAIDERQLGGAELRLSPRRRKSRREQQCILLAEGQVERRRQAEHHLAARSSACALQEAQMSLRDFSRLRERELRQRPALPPSPQPRREARIFAHNYLPRS